MLSDICNVQGVKRVIYHLIENLCVAETVKKNTLSFPFSRSLCCYLYPQGNRSNC